MEEINQGRGGSKGVGLILSRVVRRCHLEKVTHKLCACQGRGLQTEVPLGQRFLDEVCLAL